MGRLARAFVSAVLLGACLPARVDAQWYAAIYAGANHTSPALVSIDQPTLHTALVFQDVTFEGRPFHWPVYSGARVGRLMAGRRLGVELELLHLKVISQTDRSVHVTGTTEGEAVDATLPMNQFVQRYDMTHGLNFLLANLVLRTPIGELARGRPVAFVVRVGAGPVVPGTDTVVGQVLVGHYEFAGFGGQAAAGLDVPIAGPWSAIVEYKLTYAKPRISVFDGRGQTTALTNQIAFGLALGFGR